ncbi:hypothetical protein MKS87_16860 [Bacillus subtilis]|uniref:hypothetical protein n=1 Tax=Bacillus TaxID=1386 RepID=UPI0001F5B194|nr:hypothetical protein [Bacillus subtilis]ADV93928.1 hypothetical protein BSn5_06510 [Bacillus subtilis BSn5]MBR9950455.1 hypothetical protein [Bacillus subtilis]MBT2169276.1 hypothetical protein [Bacillus subtilis]MEC3661777.1 hypothetical protein [Bacillus subtilis]RAP08516.1 hypothetical protein HS3_02458 [Bacillus subtilis]
MSLSRAFYFAYGRMPSAPSFDKAAAGAGVTSSPAIGVCSAIMLLSKKQPIIPSF